MALAADLERIAGLAAGHARPGERVAAVLAAEPGEGGRVYLCAFEDGGGARSWLVLGEGGRVVERRSVVRDAASIAALCELAVETAGGGDVGSLRAQLGILREREAPEGIEEAEAAALELERVLGEPPRVASPAWLDEVGAATRRLELALGEMRSPFAEAMRAGLAPVDELADDVERGYRLPLR